MGLYMLLGILFLFLVARLIASGPEAETAETATEATPCS